MHQVQPDETQPDSLRERIEWMRANASDGLDTPRYARERKHISEAFIVTSSDGLQPSSVLATSRVGNESNGPGLLEGELRVGPLQVSDDSPVGRGSADAFDPLVLHGTETVEVKRLVSVTRLCWYI